MYKSRSDQAPGSGFHPRDESINIYYSLLGHFLGNKKIYILKDKYRTDHIKK